MLAPVAMADLRTAVAGGAATEAVFTPLAFARRILDVESALARACGDAGLIGPDVVDRLCAACARPTAEELRDALADGRSGTPVLALLRLARSHLRPEDAMHLHWGATSQDVVDTALVLQVGDGLDALEADILRVGRRAAHLAEEHRHTPMAGRTLLRQAVPISFGLKAARWVAAATRSVQALDAARGHLALQLGGAAGTSLPLGPAAAAVEDALGRRLGLVVPDLPWHAERDRLGHVVATVGVVASVLEKVAKDLLLLSVEEVGEVTLGSIGGASSAMPHKRNPVDLVYSSTAARLARGAVTTYLHAMDQEQERAAGGWQSESVVLSDAFRSAGACAHRLAEALDVLEVHPERMVENLERQGAAALAESLATDLASRIGPDRARAKVEELVQRSATSGVGLEAVAAEDAVTVAAVPDLASVFDPSRHLGSAERFIDRALATHRAVTGDRGAA